MGGGLQGCREIASVFFKICENLTYETSHLGVYHFYKNVGTVVGHELGPHKNEEIFFSKSEVKLLYVFSHIYVKPGGSKI